MLKRLVGRKLLMKELEEKEQLAVQHDEQVTILPTIVMENGRVRCFRCGHSLKKYAQQELLVGRLRYYCRFCLRMGKIDEDSVLYHQPNERTTLREVACVWQGQLTIFQQRLAQHLVINYKKQQDSLVHAVTGAGKTEMLYPLIIEVVNQGGTICLAAPRTDVCIELYKRIEPLFTCAICLIHGNSEKPFDMPPIVICTTHQLLRYYQAFDCIVLDEVDAFPFQGNPSLSYAVEQALKIDGQKVLLTATPSQEQLQQVKQNKLLKEELFLRYHGRPLPVPKLVYCSCNLNSRQKIPKTLHRLLLTQLSGARRTLIFVPTIEIGKQLMVRLRHAFPSVKIANVSSIDEERHRKVEEMRQETVDWLITTTILERGVTFANIDVIVFGAHHRIYKTSSLVQIAGRVGRKSEFPNGVVYFLHEGQSRAMKQCRKQIIKMNQIGVALQDELSKL
ncbi:DEAD/DEAH box helicase [Vagococcus zengguangii]|uniref:DEAD/DEAH box helicase n=1 Tax=Vagococcus zengguangii TaxID=2571750 RepID=A0A4D7CTS3_9ENTE|nr:DEAD/DEAH box helicase [Vagococcus zengguangii]QCI86544.1 DEAD/DEAH box helicase [Vagococcus zengguangii]TLG81206.1 DEAD/DEAH box helicase [Vagococcus zengguangii]